MGKLSAVGQPISASEMTYIVSSGALNSTHPLVNQLSLSTQTAKVYYKV